MEMDLPKNYRPSEDEPYMNPEQLEYFRQKLLLWRAELMQESGEILSLVKEKSQKVPDDVDRGVLEADNILKLRTGSRYSKLLHKIDEALGQIKVGAYGYCKETGEQIGIKRLEVRPTATLSIEAQKRHEQIERWTQVRYRR